MRQDMTDAQVCGGRLYGRGCGMRAVGGGGCVGGCGEVIAGRYEGEWSNDAIHGQGAYTAAKAGWTFTGAFAHDRPTEGELSEADGRRFAVQYAADCAAIFKHPTPSSLVLIPARTRLVQSRGMAKPQQGTGTHTFGDGTYTGEWCGGKRHGQGVMAYNSGNRCVRHAGGCAGG